MTKQFSINSNFYFSRRCQEAVRVSGPSEKGWQLEIIVSPLLEVLSVNACAEQLSDPYNGMDAATPQRVFLLRNMNTSVERASFPPDLPLTRASFYSVGSSVGDISIGMRGGYEYVAFDYDSQSGDMSHTETVVAIKTISPKTPDTNLSRASGLQLERVGEWIFAFEARRIVSRSKIDKVIDDIINLLEYAKGFPQNT